MKRKSVQKISQKFQDDPIFCYFSQKIWRWICKNQKCRTSTLAQCPNFTIVFVSVGVILWKICIILTSTLFSDYFKSHSDKLTKSNSSNSQYSKYGRNSTQINESISFMKFSKLSLKNCEFNFSKIEKLHFLARF